MKNNSTDQLAAITIIVVFIAGLLAIIEAKYFFYTLTIYVVILFISMMYLVYKDITNG